MPGLLRGVARTAVVAGTATAVSNRVSRRQANRWASQDDQAYEQQPQYVQAQPAPASRLPAMKDPIEQLKDLAVSSDSQGILTRTTSSAAQKSRDP